MVWGLGETGAAIEAYRKAIKQRKGNYPHALNNLGVMLMRQKRWDEAEEAFTSALKQEGNHYPEASSNLERLSYLRDDDPSARERQKKNAAATTQPPAPKP